MTEIAGQDVLTGAGRIKLRFDRSSGHIWAPFARTDRVVGHDHAAHSIRLEIAEHEVAHLIVTHADVVGLVGARAGILSESRLGVSEAARWGENARS